MTQQIDKDNLLSEIRRHTNGTGCSKPQVQNNNIFSHSATSTGPKFYVTADLFENSIPMLLDSGSQVTIINAANCPPDVLENLAPPPVQISAYNDTLIDVLGCFTTDLKLGDICVPQTPVFVTRNCFKSILGTPVLNRLNVDFRNRVLTLDDAKAAIQLTEETCSATNFNLQLRQARPKRSLYRLYSIDHTVIPPNTECVIPARIENKFQDYGTYVTEPASCVHSGCIVAKSISHFDRRRTNCVVRICNLMDTPKTIASHTEIVKVAAVQQIAKQRSNSSKFLSEVNIGNVDSKSKKTIEELLIHYADCFADEEGPLNETSGVEFDIDTGNSPPVSQQKYRTPYFLRNEMKRIIDKNLENGLMEECSSPWSAPTLLVKKANGKWRLVCDYRKLNAVTTSDQYPLPEIADCLNQLAESRVFTTTDLFSGFHQIRTTERAKQKLAVITDFGQYTWARMPMGAKNCPSVFQRMMDKCFRSMPLNSLVIYLDDILVHSRTLEEHIPKLEQLFRLLRKNNLQIRADKTKIAHSEIAFCGYRIKDGYKYPNGEKVKAVKELKTPSSTKMAQGVFGLLNYHRSFIPNFAKKAMPITKTYNTKGRFKWPKEADDALRILKREICDAALHLKIPALSTAKFVLETDACDTGYGATLFICQKKTKHENHNSTCLRPVEYMSCQFTPAQVKYYIQEKELFAAKEAMRKWNHYLLGRPFDWHIDNACLKWAYRIRSSKLRISQWLAEISEYQINTILKKSSQMKISDCLSRQFAELNSIRVTKSEIANLQENDELLKNIRTYAANDRWPNEQDENVKFFSKQRSNIVFGTSGEMLIKTPLGVKIVVPRGIQAELIRTYHDDIGHPGIDKTLSELGTRYIWPRMESDVKKFIQTCHHCQISKPNLKPKQPPLGLSHTPCQPFESLSFDLIGPLAMTDREHKYCLVGTDLFSKKIYAAPLCSKQSDEVQEQIEKIIFSQPFMPRRLLSDNGLEFVGLTPFCDEYGIRYSHSPPYHPQTNGSVERMNQTLKQRLFEVGQEDTWDIRLTRIVHAINCSKNAVTGFSPFELETGYFGQNANDQIDHVQQTRDIQDIRKTAHKRILEEKGERVDRCRKDNFVPFSIGELVLAKNHLQKMPRFVGPFEVVKLRGDGLSVELKRLDGYSTQIRPITDLKKYNLRENVPAGPGSDDQTAPPGGTTTVSTEAGSNEPVSSFDVFEDEDFEINFFARSTDELPHHTSRAVGRDSEPGMTSESESTLDGSDGNGGLRATPHKKLDTASRAVGPDSPIATSEQESSLEHSDEDANRDRDDIRSQDDGSSDRTNDFDSNIASDQDGSELGSHTSDGPSIIDANTDNEHHLFSDEELNEMNESVYESAAENSDENVDMDKTMIERPHPEDPLNADETARAGAPTCPTQNKPEQFVFHRAQSGKISPRPDIRYELKLYQMTAQEVQNVGSNFNIDLSGTVFLKKKQIDEFFEKHHPNHTRTKEGHLVFQTSFDPATKSKLRKMTTQELKALIKAYSLPQPSLFGSKDLYKHVRKHLLKKYPNCLVNDDIEFRTPRSNSPEVHAKRDKQSQ